MKYMHSYLERTQSGECRKKWRKKQLPNTKIHFCICNLLIPCTIIFTGKAACINRLCITPKELDYRLGEFGHYCPVCLALHHHLVDCSETVALTHAAEYKRRYYRLCYENHLEVLDLQIMITYIWLNSFHTCPEFNLYYGVFTIEIPVNSWRVCGTSLSTQPPTAPPTAKKADSTPGEKQIPKAGWNEGLLSCHLHGWKAEVYNHVKNYNSLFIKSSWSITCSEYV